MPEREPHGLERDRRRARGWVLALAVITGVGLMGAIDAIAFHHLLRWHNLYVHAGADWRAIGDGLLHLATTSMLLVGLTMLWRRRALVAAGRVGGGVLLGGVWLGMGAFQLLDGTLFHLVLRLHPVREGFESVLVYDVVWIGSALALLALGGVVVRRSR